MVDRLFYGTLVLHARGYEPMFTMYALPDTRKGIVNAQGASSCDDDVKRA